MGSPIPGLFLNRSTTPRLKLVIQMEQYPVQPLYYISTDIKVNKTLNLQGNFLVLFLTVLHVGN